MPIDRALVARRRATTRIWGLIAALTALSVLVVAFTPLDGVVGPYRIPWWVIATAFGLAEVATIHVHVKTDSHTVSLVEVPLVVGLALASPLTLIVGRLTGSALALVIHRRQGPTKLAFNLALFTLETSLAIAVHAALLGSGDPIGPHGWFAALTAIAVATAVGWSAVTAAITLNDRRRRVHELARSAAPGVGISLTTGFIALPVTIAMWVSPAGSVLVAGMALVVLAGLKVYSALSSRHDELRSIHSFATDIASQRTLESVIGSFLDDLLAVLRVRVAEIAVRSADDDAWTVFSAEDEWGHLDLDVDMQRRATKLWSALGEDIVHMSELEFDEHDGAYLRLRGFSNALVMPIGGRDLEGFVIVADRFGSDAFSRADEAMLTTLTTQTAVTVERAHLIESLENEIRIREHPRVHDALTGLPNRTHLLEAIDAAASTRVPFAVALIDLDRFKEVNDTLGHRHGDALIEAVGARLAASVRGGDLVARIGGDEYGILFRDVKNANDGIQLSRRITEALEEPFTMQRVALGVDASIGIAVSPEHGIDTATLMRRADIAMYEAKGSLRHVEVYDLETDPMTRRRLTLANDLRSAVDEGKIEVYFQPKTAVRAQVVSGLEALARWDHDEYGPISPLEFIPIAEHTGAITGLTYSVLSRSLDELVEWRSRAHDVTVAVNISTRILEDERFPVAVENELMFRGVPAEALTLEITESAAMAKSDRVERVLSALDDIGVKISIDDFGTGFSSLAYLRRLPVDEVKIDRAFVKDMAMVEQDAKIVRSTIDLMHGLGFVVVAEGVEDRPTWDALEAAGCDVIQGYYVAKPMTALDAGQFLDGWTGLPD